MIYVTWKFISASAWLSSNRLLFALEKVSPT